MSNQKRSKRKPISDGKYFEIHFGKMAKLQEERIVVDDDLDINFDEPEMITMIGTIRFDGPVVLSVKKWIVYVTHNEKECVETKLYSYQCHVGGVPDSEIFRYDNYHGDNPHDGHAEPHHVHRFDPPGKQIQGSPFEVSDDERPWFDEIIREAAAANEKYKSTGGKAGTRKGDTRGGQRAW